MLRLCVEVLFVFVCLCCCCVLGGVGFESLLLFPLFFVPCDCLLFYCLSFVFDYMFFVFVSCFLWGFGCAHFSIPPQVCFSLFFVSLMFALFVVNVDFVVLID